MHIGARGPPSPIQENQPNQEAVRKPRGPCHQRGYGSTKECLIPLEGKCSPGGRELLQVRECCLWERPKEEALMNGVTLAC